MIEICASNLTTSYLKEDIGHFRNLCQHTNMNLIEDVLKSLRSKAEDNINQLKEKVTVQKIRDILNNDIEENATL